MENGGRFASLLAQERGRTIDDLAGFDRRAALDAGLDDATVTTWSRIHAAYYGKTRCTRLQRTAVEAARGGGVPLSRLGSIERLVAHVPDEAERWRLRLELLEVKGRCGAVRRRAKEIVPAKQSAPPAPGVRFTRSREGTRQMLITATAREITDIEHAVRRGLDSDRPESPQMLDRFFTLLSGEGVPVAAPRPIVAVPLPAHLEVISGAGSEVTLRATDGTTMSGAEYLALHHSAELEVALFHPQDGPVNLYRTKRFANDKQRALVSATSPECAWVGCAKPADFCETHHITAWKHGGETNLANLAPLCRYHNRVNEDDTHLRKRGRIARIRGRPAWVSPDGYSVTKQSGAMHDLFSTPAA